MNEIQSQKENYRVFSPNGNILKTAPNEESAIPNPEFENNIKVFGPFKTYAAMPALKPEVLQNAKVDNKGNLLDENGEPLINETSLTDSLSGSVGAMILGPVIGTALGQHMNLSHQMTEKAIGLSEKAIHIGLDAIEVSDSLKDNKVAKQSTVQVANATVNTSYVFGVGGVQIPDRMEASQRMEGKVEAQAKESKTNKINLSESDKFQARHSTYGKRGKK